MTFTREQIIAWAKEADVWVVEQEPYQTQLDRFAALIEQATIERCIDLVAMYGGPVDLEAAIRALKEQA